MQNKNSKSRVPTKSAKTPSLRTAKPDIQPLVFIDTNILLDFYRARNDAGVSLLKKIDDLHEIIITTCQVEMEFKKNRQAVIKDSFNLLKAPSFDLVPPAFLAESATVQVIKKRVTDITARVKKLKARLLLTMENPKTHDRIYQSVQRLFRNESSLNLRHNTTPYRKVWRSSLRRFMEGRPPRKKDDTAAGDAVNWEWIVQCVLNTNRDVIIVSRDADYGVVIDHIGYVNNWLLEELKERTNPRRKVMLVDRLSFALDKLKIPVTPEEIRAELTTINPKPKTTDRKIENLVQDYSETLFDDPVIVDLMKEAKGTDWHYTFFSIDDISEFADAVVASVSFSIAPRPRKGNATKETMITGFCTFNIEDGRFQCVNVLDADLDS